LPNQGDPSRFDLIQHSLAQRVVLQSAVCFDCDERFRLRKRLEYTTTSPNWPHQPSDQRPFS
jgi:hypothetical protein